jgi:glycosyltransferase involved in cell wall biosynthesis
VNDTWILYDDGKAGHHPGYVNRIVEAVQRAGVRPIVASPDRPTTLTNPEDWIEVNARSLRAVVHNWRQMRRVAAMGRAMGAQVFIDLYLDKNVWVAGAVRSFDSRVHVLHHAIQYRTDVRRGWARVRTAFLRRRLGRMTRRGAIILVHTSRAAEIIGRAVDARGMRIVGFPVPMSPPPTRRDRPDPPVLLFTGAGRPDKGLDLLIHALDLMDHRARLRVVGSQPSGVRQNIDRDEFRGITWVDRRVTDDELWEEYGRASLAVLPYRQSYGDEGAPSSVLLEMLAFGVPVVTTRALADQLPADGRGAVVADSEDPSDLAQALDSALGRLEDLSREAIQAGPAFIAANHTYDHYVEALAMAANDSRRGMAAMWPPSHT